MGISYRREIDGLRAIAVLAVVLYHAGATSSAGFVGVDIFFVISGYLITALLLREHVTNGRIDFTAFYARRVRRIFPAAMVMLLAVAFASLLFLRGVDLIRAYDSITASALFAANLYFQANTYGYFDGNVETMPLLHMWSLAVEEQFYLVWPLALLLLARWRPALGIGLLAVASFVLAEWLIPHHAKTAFFQMPPRFWELAAGGLIAAAPTRPLPRWLPWLGLALTLDACIVPTGHHFPGTGALPAVAGAAMIIASVHGGGQNALLASRPMVAIGLISYPLYLWHWPLLAFYRALGGNDPTTRLLLCGAAVILAAASYRYIEQPLRKRGSNRGAVAVGFGAFAVLALTAASTSYRENQTPAAIASRDMPAIAALCSRSRGDARMPGAECESAPGKPVRVAIWGDSLALAWQPLAWELARRQGASAIDYTKNNCPPAQNFRVVAMAECADWNAAIAQRVGHLDTVILAGRWDGTPNSRALHAGLPATMDALRSVRRVIVIGPTPTLRADAPGCMGGMDIARCSLTLSVFHAATDGERAFLRALVAGYPNAEYVEASDWLCDSLCRGNRKGTVLYWDNVHPSSTAARQFAEQFQ